MPPQSPSRITAVVTGLAEAVVTGLAAPAHAGPEARTFDRVTYTARSRGLRSHRAEPRGAIYPLNLTHAFDVADPRAVPVDLTNDSFADADSHPHGIDLFVAEDGRAHLRISRLILTKCHNQLQGLMPCHF